MFQLVILLSALITLPLMIKNGYIVDGLYAFTCAWIDSPYQINWLVFCFMLSLITNIMDYLIYLKNDRN